MTNASMPSGERMAIEHQRIIRKEVLPCRCLRYVYEHGLDVLYCERHARMINSKEINRVDLQLTLNELYTKPAFVPQTQGTPDKHWKYIMCTCYLLATLTTFACVLTSVRTPRIVAAHPPVTKTERNPVWAFKDVQFPDRRFDDALLSTPKPGQEWGLTEGVIKGYPDPLILRSRMNTR